MRTMILMAVLAVATPAVAETGTYWSKDGIMVEVDRDYARSHGLREVTDDERYAEVQRQAARERAQEESDASRNTWLWTIAAAIVGVGLLFVLVQWTKKARKR